jgi:hypothetical protein
VTTTRPYAIQQHTGGWGDLSMQGLGVVPFTEVKNARRVDDFYTRLSELEGEAASAKKRAAGSRARANCG